MNSFITSMPVHNIYRLMEFIFLPLCLIYSRVYKIEPTYAIRNCATILLLYGDKNNYINCVMWGLVSGGGPIN